MNIEKQRSGYTLIEMMIAIAIMVLIGTVVTLSLVGKRNSNDLNNTTTQIGALLRQAQSDSLSEEKGASWGVHFDDTNGPAPFYSLFYTMNGTYSSSSEVGHYPLPADLCFASSTVSPGGTLDIIFSQVSGAPISGSSTSIGLQLEGCGTASTTSSGAPAVTQTGSGKIFFDDFNRATL